MTKNTPVIRYFTLPNGDRIMHLRESTLLAGIKAAGRAIAVAHSPDECCHKTRLVGAGCPIGWKCPYITETQDV